MKILKLVAFILCLVVGVSGCISSQESKKEGDEISPNVANAFEMYKQGRYQSALVYCDKAIKENPNDKWAWYLKGKVYYQLNKSAEAIECFNKSIQIDPNFADAYFWMGLTYKSYYESNSIIKHDYKTARVYIKKAVELDPNNDIYYYFLAQCYIFDNLDKSIEYTDKAIELNPNVAEYWVQKADYLELKHDYDNALACYDEALKIEPNNVDIMLKKAELYHKMGLTYKEEEILKEVEKIDPKRAKFYRLSPQS